MNWGCRKTEQLIYGTLITIGTILAQKPKVPLTANLSGTWETVSAEFDQRVRDRFPIGSSQEAMRIELREQGFTQSDRNSAADFEQEAVRREDNGVCNQSARIFWRTGGEGRLIGIRGQYREEGCL